MNCNICTILPPSGNIVPNDQKFAIFSEILIINLVVKTNPTIKKEEIQNWGAKTNNKTTKKQASVIFCISLLGFYFYWMIIWKKKIFCLLKTLQNITKLVQRKVVVHTKTFFMDKLTNILQKVSHEKTQYLILDKFQRS